MTEGLSATFAGPPATTDDTPSILESAPFRPPGRTHPERQKEKKTGTVDQKHNLPGMSDQGGNLASPEQRFIMSSPRTKQTTVNLIQAMAAGIAKYFASASSFTLNNESTQKTAILAAFQAYLAAVVLAASSKAQYASSVQAEKTALAACDAFLKAMTSYVRVTYGNDPAILADFGLKPLTRKAPTAKVAAEAVLQRAQTRVLRHTTGSKQRLEIKAAPATAAPTTTPTPKP